MAYHFILNCELRGEGGTTVNEYGHPLTQKNTNPLWFANILNVIIRRTTMCFSLVGVKNG